MPSASQVAVPYLLTQNGFVLRNRGKYTGGLNKTTTSRRQDSFVLDDNVFDTLSDDRGPFEYIVIEPFGRFNKFKVISASMEAEYRRLKKANNLRETGCVSVNDIFRDKKNLLLSIRNNQVSLNNSANIDSVRMTQTLHDEIQPLADELLVLCEEFQSEISSRFDGTSDNQELFKLKQFIDSINFNSLGEPMAENIGALNANERKSKYLKLALFLASYDEKNGYQNLTGLSVKYKNLLNRIVELRQFIVLSLTKWLRTCLGGYFDFICSSEGVMVDNMFKNSVKVDYEDNSSKSQSYYETEILKKDTAIKVQFEENERLKKELASIRGSLIHFSSQESTISDLRLKLQKAEEENNLHRNIVSSVSQENMKLTSKNTENTNLINNLASQLDNTKVIFQSNMNSGLNDVRVQYEAKLAELTKDLSDMKNRHTLLENKYNTESKQWATEKESYNGKMQILIQHHSNENKGYNDKLNLAMSENSNLKVNLEKVNQERDLQLKLVQDLRNELKANQLSYGNMSSLYSVNLKKNEELTAELNGLKLRSGNFANETASYTQKIEMLMGNINNLAKERDELKNKIVSQKADYDKLNLELQNHLNMRVSYDARIKLLEEEKKKLADALGKLQLELNQKIVIIGDLGKKNQELETHRMTVSSQNDMNVNNMKRYELLIATMTDENNKKIAGLEKMLLEYKTKESNLIMINSDREKELALLKMTISSCREDWLKLCDSYESLLKDAKEQLSLNESLRNLCLELLNKIDLHNQSVGGNDLAIKQQIELLTKHSLSKKVIDMNKNYSNEVSLACNSINNLRTKLGKTEAAQLNKSAVFSNLANLNLGTPSVKQTTNQVVSSSVVSAYAPVYSEVPSRPNIQRTTVSGVNVDINKYINNAGFNNSIDLTKGEVQVNNGTGLIDMNGPRFSHNVSSSNYNLSSFVNNGYNHN